MGMDYQTAYSISVIQAIRFLERTTKARQEEEELTNMRLRQILKAQGCTFPEDSNLVDPAAGL